MLGRIRIPARWLNPFASATFMTAVGTLTACLALASSFSNAAYGQVDGVVVVTSDGSFQSGVPVPESPAVVDETDESSEEAAQEGETQAPDASATADGTPTPPPDANATPGATPTTPAASAAPATATNVQRPTTPPEPPDPKEFEVSPDGEGLVRFQFRNQPWPDVLRWLAKISDLSLDWQELPGDYINLATQRPFTVEEATDMINRALLTRGFTILNHDGVLLVVKTESINPALVPRVEPAELSTLPPHRFVRTSFALHWLIAEEVNVEFASMISKNGKLTPLIATNRLEAMDAVSNLRDIYQILDDEQSGQARQDLAREFVLVHARASAIKLQLEEFLGIKSNTRRASSGSTDPMQMMQEQMQMQMQMQQMQMQQQQQAAQTPGAAGPRRSTELYLIANDRTNSLIVHAPPNKMAIIEAFIQRVDVPNENAADFQRLNTRMKVFRLASLDPLQLVESLNAMDVLEPGTRLQVDESNKAIIAYASIADQYLIQSVVDRLDGSERSFEVIQLRRLEADAVAGSIKFLMGAEEEDSNSNNRGYSYYDYYGGWGGNNRNDKKSDKMRVGANIQDNQLLLWANTIEMEEVRNLLVKLGEVPPEGGRRNTVRVIDASRQPETYQYLLQLKEQWEKFSTNPLSIPDASEFKPQELPPDEDPDAPPTPDADRDGAKGKDDDKVTSKLDSEFRELLVSSPFATDDQLGTSKSSGLPPSSVSNPDLRPRLKDELGANPATALRGSTSIDAAVPGSAVPAPPSTTPIRIELDEGGNLVIVSEDTQALDRLEEYMLANRPPRKPYDIFKVRYARASWVTLNLREYFEKKDADDRPRMYSFFFDEFDTGNKKDDSQQLGKKPPLRFIHDNDTNSIVVTGADDTDRRTIKELIALWDVPEPEDDKDKDRYTRLLRIKYSKAEAIVNTIKEAYRDLLSATDKSVQNPSGNQEEKRGSGGGVVQSSGGLSYSFKGKLSLGADTITNSILISAEGEALMKIICDMIEELDVAAKPQGTMEVYQMNSAVHGKSFERALRAMLNSPSRQQPQQQQPQPNEVQTQQPAAEVQATETYEGQVSE